MADIYRFSEKAFQQRQLNQRKVGVGSDLSVVPEGDVGSGLCNRS